MRITIAEATVPSTTSTITIELRDNDWFYVTRTAHVGVANYLSCAKKDLASARVAANDLWIDAVNRRNLSAIRKGA